MGTLSVHAMAASTCACAHTQQSACEHDCCDRLGFGALLACWVPLQWCSAWRAHPLASQGLHFQAYQHAQMEPSRGKTGGAPYK